MKKTLLILLCSISQILSIAQNATITPLFELDNAAITTISKNGKWACGSAFNNNDGAGYQSAASKWNLETGERIYLVEEEEKEAQSDAFCISEDGTLVGGQYLYLPAYNLNGTWHVLDSMPKGYTIGEIRDMAIVGSDTIFVGRLFDSEGYQKVISAQWLNGKLQKVVDLIPREYQYNEDNKMANQIISISPDGRVILGSIDPFCWPCRTPFLIKDSVFTLLTIDKREEFSGYHAGIDFFKEEKLNQDGKYIALSFFGHNTHIPCIYDIEKEQFKLIKEAPAETSCKAIDENGNAYYAGPVTTGFDRKSYITIHDEAVCIDDILKEKFDVSQEEINATCADPDLTGSIRFIYDVALDGKTIVGCAGYGTGGYNWVLKLKYTLFEDVPDAIENITYNNSAAYYAQGQINIVGNADAIEVYDITGAKVMNQEVDGNSIEANLTDGIYIVKIYANNTISTGKIIIR